MGYRWLSKINARQKHAQISWCCKRRRISFLFYISSSSSTFICLLLNHLWDSPFYKIYPIITGRYLYRQSHAKAIILFIFKICNQLFLPFIITSSVLVLAHIFNTPYCDCINKLVNKTKWSITIGIDDKWLLNNNSNSIDQTIVQKIMLNSKCNLVN